ncbi:hypothetical protein FRC19_000427 [Serendipita sp. 401]|nr:hypothetical protein FRC19_000427 [Serendipita sp. 401]KAG9051815.1 hypothetical protein FS842_010989 [Serendipita sp. 407]
MNISTSWTGIPRDYREEERLRLEHQLFSNISFDGRIDDNDNRHQPALEITYREGDEDGSEFSIEFPRNPQKHLLSRDLSVRYPATEDEEAGETKSTVAHHASALTFRTGLRGRVRDYSLSGIEYDPDRKLDALVRGTSELSLLRDDSPRDAQKSYKDASSSRSEFTRRANGLGKQIDREKTRRPAKHEDHDPEPALTQGLPPARAPKYNTVPHERDPFTRPSVFPAFSRVQLPDVTGITSAVATPLKGDASFKKIPRSGQKHSSVKFRLPPAMLSAEQAGEGTNAGALDVLTQRLRDIETENATSRRRVTELELELEACKDEVAQEKTRLDELTRNGIDRRTGQSTSHGSRAFAANTREKPDMSLRETERRYKEALEEKQALEELVQSLRSHLAAMSEKVQTHQDLISNLRIKREQDAQQLRLKCREIERLRTDVDSLQKDVDRLREVVEAGLRERKTSRGAPDEPSVILIQQDSPLEEEHSTFDNSLLRRPARIEGERNVLSAVMEEEEPVSATISKAEPGKATMVQSSRPFLQGAELDRVRAEMEERRSQRSMNASGSGSDTSGPRHTIRLQSRSFTRAQEGRASPVPATTTNKRGYRNSPPRPLTPESNAPSPRLPAERPQREQQEEERRDGAVSPISLPQIRGERLERLFHAAPAHNEQTCTVCHRRKRSSTSGRRRSSHSTKPHHGHRRRHSAQEQPDGNDAEEEIDVNGEEVAQFLEGDERYISEIAERRGIPPQTVLARVLRELEDDFTHYKSIYVELADEYKAMDAASDMSKRNLLANHLREVIDVLEQKGDQIASLYDLLHFEDRPLPRPQQTAMGRRRTSHENALA